MIGFGGGKRNGFFGQLYRRCRQKITASYQRENEEFRARYQEFEAEQPLLIRIREIENTLRELGEERVKEKFNWSVERARLKARVEEMEQGWEDDHNRLVLLGRRDRELFLRANRAKRAYRRECNREE